MSNNKTFQIAFLVSIIIHSVLLIGLPRIPLMPRKLSVPEMKITYFKDVQTAVIKKEIPRKKKSLPVIRDIPEIKKEEILQPPKTVNKKIKEAEKPEIKTREDSAIEKADIKEKKFDNIVQEEADNVKKAAYISYYKEVRERIRQRADRNYPADKSLGQGDILLSFLVSSEGELLDVRVIEERSTNNPILKKIALQSVYDASPFQPFPKGMSQYQITFNVIISFEDK